MRNQNQLKSFLSSRGESNLSGISENTILQDYFNTLSYAEMDEFLTAVREARFGRLTKKRTVLKKSPSKQEITEKDKNRLKVILSRHKVLAKYAQNACQQETFVRLCFNTPLSDSFDMIQQAARLACFNLLTENEVKALRHPDVVEALKAIPSFTSLKGKGLRAAIEKAIKEGFDKSKASTKGETKSTRQKITQSQTVKMRANPLYVGTAFRKERSEEPVYMTMKAPIYENVDPLYDTVEKRTEAVDQNLNTSGNIPSSMYALLTTAPENEYSHLQTVSPVYENITLAVKASAGVYDTLRQRDKSVYAHLDTAEPLYENVIGTQRTVYDRLEPRETSVYETLHREEAIYENIDASFKGAANLYDTLNKKKKRVSAKYQPADSPVYDTIEKPSVNMNTYERMSLQAASSSETQEYMSMSLSLEKALVWEMVSSIGENPYIKTTVSQLLAEVKDSDALAKMDVNSFNQVTEYWPKGTLDALKVLLKKGIYADSIVREIIQTPSIIDWINLVPLSEVTYERFLVKHGECILDNREATKKAIPHYQRKIEDLKANKIFQALPITYQNSLVSEANAQKGELPNGLLRAMKKLSKRKIKLNHIVTDFIKHPDLIDWVNKRGSILKPLSKSRLQYKLFKLENKVSECQV